MRIYGQEEAARAVQANTTPRMLQLGKLRRYVTGDQYEGRPKWHTDDVPVWEREPAIIWQAAEGAITSNEDLLLGEGRYPFVTSRPEEDGSDEDELLDKESSEKLDRLIQEVEKESCLRAHCREAYKDAQSVGTCVGLFGARNAKLFAETIPAEYATAEFDQLGNVSKLVIQYPYVDTVRESDGRWFARAKIFRREIDATRDVTFLPGEARVDGIAPEWKEDPKQTFAHGLGFCPVLWHKFRLVSSIVTDTDGRAIHSTQLDELDAYNLEASMRYEGALYSLPQIYEIGVDPGYNPTQTDAQQSLIVYGTSEGGSFAPHSPPTERFTAPRQARPPGARLKGPRRIWQYSNPETEVGQVDTNAGTLESLANTLADTKARICEALAWVALNPEEIKFAAALSGKALERLMARQLNRVAKDRDGFGDSYLKLAYLMLLRIAATKQAELKTRYLKKTLAIVSSFGVGQEWNAPALTLRWGAWFTPTADDDDKLVASTKNAHDAGFITLRTAIEKVKRTFGIEDVDAYLEALEKEAQQRREQAEEEMRQNTAKVHASLIGDDNDSAEGRRGRPAGDGKGGSGKPGSIPGSVGKPA